MSKFMGLLRVAVVIAITAGTFLGGMRFEQKVLAPRRRAASLAKFRAAMDVKRLQGRLGGVPCKPCEENKKKAGKATFTPASKGVARKIIRTAAPQGKGGGQNGPPVQLCTPGAYIPPPPGEGSGVLRTHINDDDTDIEVWSQLTCGGGGNSPCQVVFIGTVWSFTPGSIPAENGWAAEGQVCLPFDPIPCNTTPEDSDGKIGAGGDLNLGAVLPAGNYALYGSMYSGTCAAQIGASFMDTGGDIFDGPIEYFTIGEGGAFSNLSTGEGSPIPPLPKNRF